MVVSAPDIAEPKMGDTIDINQDQYGHIEPCKFCGGDQSEFPALWYNGYGPPPSYAVACGNCGAQGPTSRGRERDDHFGAREDAVRLWNASPKEKP